VIATLWLFALGIPARHELMLGTCLDGQCGRFELSEGTAQTLQDLGLSLHIYAAYLSVLAAVAVLACVVAATVVFWRRPNSWMPLFVAFTLVAFLPAYFLSVMEALVRTNPDLRLVVSVAQGVGVWFMLVFSYVFPNGRFFPHWTRPLAVLATATALALLFFAPIRLFVLSASFVEVVLTNALVGLMIAAVVALVFRYRHGSNAAEKQQIKWFVFGFSALVVGGIVHSLGPVLFPSLRQPGMPELLYMVVGGTLNIVYLLLLVASFLLAILRHRLLDIDVIISRALVYGPLSAVLVVLYLVSVMIFQRIFLLLTAQESTLALIISTLATAAAFRPLQEFVQSEIDRRFYRTKYDADQILTAFTDTLRHEVDLDNLSDRLSGVVQEAMQPTHVSLWLRRGVTPRDALPMHRPDFPQSH
jgi:hypothetical protein